MCVRPKPQMRRRGAVGRGTPESQSNTGDRKAKPTAWASELQGGLRRVYALCHDTAVTIARSAFGVAR
jgi:hypothetical protein